MTDEIKSDNDVAKDTPRFEKEETKSSPDSSNAVPQTLKYIIENSGAVEQLVSLVSKPLSEYKLKELEYKREIEKGQLAIEKAEHSTSKHKFWGIVLILIVLIQYFTNFSPPP